MKQKSREQTMNMTLTTMRKEQVADLLEKGESEELQVIHDGSRYQILVTIPSEARLPEEQKHSAQESSEGRWAKVARELGDANILGGGAGEELQKHIKDFREGFEFRDVDLSKTK